MAHTEMLNKCLWKGNVTIVILYKYWVVAISSEVTKFPVITYKEMIL